MVVKQCVDWFTGTSTYWGCYLVDKQHGAKLGTRYSRICCREVTMSASNYTAHIETYHAVFFNVMCLNKNTLRDMKHVVNLDAVLSTFNCVLFNSPCNCVECSKLTSVW